MSNPDHIIEDQQYCYRQLTHGGYIFSLSSSTPIDTISIAYSFDGQHAVLHKHGDRSLVDKWCDNAKTKYINANLPIYAQQIHVAYDVPYQQVNHMIACTGYITKWHNQYINPDNMYINIYDQSDA